MTRVFTRNGPHPSSAGLPPRAAEEPAECSAVRRLHRAEDGQALIWGAGVLVLIVALFYGAIDVGEVVLGKIEAQNAADAAAMTASAVKASVHNTRSMAYRAATGQLVLCRMELVEATGAALEAISAGQAMQPVYAKAMANAELHHKRLELLRQGIGQFNQFVTGKDGPEITMAAAQVGYKGNLGTLGTIIPSNLSLLDSKSALPEFGQGFAAGVTLSTESMTPMGHSGKTAVVVEPKTSVFGGGLLGYNSQEDLSAKAMAGPMDANELYGSSLRAINDYGIHWYVTRLLPIGLGTGPLK